MGQGWCVPADDGIGEGRGARSRKRSRSGRDFPTWRLYSARLRQPQFHDMLRMVVGQRNRQPRLFGPVDQQSRRRALPGFLAHVDAVDGIAEAIAHAVAGPVGGDRSEEHTSELQSLMRVSYAVLGLNKKQKNVQIKYTHNHYQGWPER